jgi:predicted NAD/FAD-binding protein
MAAESWRPNSCLLCSSASGSEHAAVCVSYWLNLLQNLPPGTPNMFVTLNPLHPPAPDTVLKQLKLAHPVFSPDMVAAQAALPSVQVQSSKSALPQTTCGLNVARTCL